MPIRRRFGFSILAMLIAFAIFSMAFGTPFSLFGQGVTLTVGHREYTVALHLVEDMLHRQFVEIDKMPVGTPPLDLTDEDITAKVESLYPGQLIVPAGLAALVIGLASQSPFWQKTTATSVEKTTLTRELRNQSLAVTRTPHEATLFLYPDRNDSDPVHLLSFLNRQASAGGVRSMPSRVVIFSPVFGVRTTISDPASRAKRT